MTESVDDDIFIQHPTLKNLLRVLTICKGFALYFASCNTVELREVLVASLKEKLNRPILELSLDSQNNIYIAAQAEDLIKPADESAVLFIYGLEKLYYLKDRHIMQELQWHRERYGRLKRPIVFWLPDFLITEIFHEAPDFMDWRSGIYEFNLSQQDKQTLLVNTHESVSEHFVDQLTLAEKQRWIVNLENLLVELGAENNNTRHDLLNRLGVLYYSIGNYDKALQCYQQNLPLCQSLDDKKNEGATLNNISQIYHAKGDYDTALHYLEQSLKLIHDIGNKHGEGATLNNIFAIYYAKGDYDTALSYLEQALKIAQDIGDLYGESVILSNFGYLHDTKGNQPQALSYRKQSYQIAKKIGAADILQALEELAKRLGGNGLDFWEKLSEHD